jgi:hypothetical protein
MVPVFVFYTAILSMHIFRKLDWSVSARQKHTYVQHLGFILMKCDLALISRPSMEGEQKQQSDTSPLPLPPFFFFFFFVMALEFETTMPPGLLLYFSNRVLSFCWCLSAL